MPRSHSGTQKQPDFSSAAQGVRSLCRTYGVRPSRDRGQNFLLDPAVAHTAAAAGELTTSSRVIEVGGGFGMLTDALLATGAHVTTVELDERLCGALCKRFRAKKNFGCVHGDFLRWYREQSPKLAGHPFSVIANLPYSISAFFFRTVLVGSCVPKQIIVLLQKEVAERIAAAPGDMSALSVLVQSCGKPEVLLNVPRTTFWPQPEVDSALLAVRDIHPPDGHFADVMKTARIAFAGRRKQLQNSLANGLHRDAGDIADLLRSLGLDPAARPQELGIADWRHLAEAVRTLLDENPSSFVPPNGTSKGSAPLKSSGKPEPPARGLNPGVRLFD